MKRLPDLLRCRWKVELDRVSPQVWPCTKVTSIERIQEAVRANLADLEQVKV
jgi:hypothetical protein